MNRSIPAMHHIGGGLCQVEVITAGGAALRGSRACADRLPWMSGGLDSGTHARIEDTKILDTLPNANGEGGYGIGAFGGATLSARGCELRDNTAVGLVAHSGTEVSVIESIVSGTRVDDNGLHGIGMMALDGAALSAVGCVLDGNTRAGIWGYDTGTEISLLNTTVRGTHFSADREGGFGVSIGEGAQFSAERCSVENNAVVGVLATDPGTQVILHDSSITGTSIGIGEECTAALGLVAQHGASVSASDLLVRDNEGPGVYAVGASRLACSRCSLIANDFAGAAVLDGGVLELTSSRIEETAESVNLGGGVGIYAAEQQDLAPPSLSVSGGTVAENLVAGAYLVGQGDFQLEASTFSGSSGVGHGGTVRCGDGVYAQGTEAWDGNSGLLLAGNALTDNAGAGLFLNDGWALLDSNAWSGNSPELFAQGDACSAPGEDWAEVPGSEICLGWDKPICELEFTLNLMVQEPTRTVSPRASLPPHIVLEPTPTLAVHQATPPYRLF